MKDINWHIMDDDNGESSKLLKQNPEKNLVVLTDVTYRTIHAKYVNPDNGYVKFFDETIIKFAFLD